MSNTTFLFLVTAVAHIGSFSNSFTSNRNIKSAEEFGMRFPTSSAHAGAIPIPVTTAYLRVTGFNGAIIPPFAGSTVARIILARNLLAMFSYFLGNSRGILLKSITYIF